MSTDRTLNGTEPAADQTTSDRDDIPRTGDSLSAERTERRRQRIATRQARTASEPRAGSHRDATTELANWSNPRRAGRRRLGHRPPCRCAHRDRLGSATELLTLRMSQHRGADHGSQ